MYDAVALEDPLRLSTLRALPKAPDTVLDGLLRFAIGTIGASTAAVNLVDATFILPQTVAGPLASACRNRSAIWTCGRRKSYFCAHVVATGRPLVIADTQADAFYASHPAVEGLPHIRRYVGAPIVVDGQPVGAFCAFDDTALAFGAGASDQMRLLADMAARRYEARRDASLARNLLDCIPDGWGVVTDDLVVRDVNAATCSLLGRSFGEIVGRRAVDFVAPEVRGRWLSAAAAISTTPGVGVQVVNTTLLRRTGERAPVRLWLKTWKDGDTSMIGGIIRSVQEGRDIGLSARQEECLHWAGAGKTDAEIAVLIGLASSTVHNHIEAAKRKLGVATRIQAILAAYRIDQADLIRSFAQRPD